MTDDLVQRLRRTYRKEFPVTGSMIADNSNRLRPVPILAAEVPFNPDGREAADRIEQLAWMPDTCAYRLIYEGKAQFDWHPLVSGDPASTLQRGHAASGTLVSEHEAGPLEDHVV